VCVRVCVRRVRREYNTCVCVCVKYTFRNWLKPARESLLFKRAHGIIFYYKQTKREKNIRKQNTNTHIIYRKSHTHTHTITYGHTHANARVCARAGGGSDEVSSYVCPFRYNFVCNLMKTVVFQNDNLYKWSITLERSRLNEYIRMCVYYIAGPEL